MLANVWKTEPPGDRGFLLNVYCFRSCRLLIDTLPVIVSMITTLKPPTSNLYLFFKTELMAKDKNKIDSEIFKSEFNFKCFSLIFVKKIPT